MPSYIELRSPSPEPTPLLPIDAINGVLDPEFSAQPTEKAVTSISQQSSHTTTDGRSGQMISQNDPYVTSTIYNANLAAMPLAKILNKFQTLDSSGHLNQHPWISFELGAFGRVTAYEEDSLGTFVGKLFISDYPGQRTSFLEIILMLVRAGLVSTSHLLETILQKSNGRAVKILKEFAREVDISQAGSMALGTAAYLNNFEAVDMLLDEHVDINGSISAPHSTPECECKMGLVAYAQLPRLDGEGQGASDRMIAYLLRRGAANSTEDDSCLFDLLNCVLRQEADEPILFPTVRAIVERINGFADFVWETGRVLETCIVKARTEEDGGESRVEVFDYLLAKGAKASSGSLLAGLIYNSFPQEFFWDLLEKTEDINAYCNSLHRNWDFESVNWNNGPYHMKKSINPLQAAALQGNETIMYVLLQKGAYVNCPARGFCGVTPLQGICRFEAWLPQERRKKMRSVKMLLDRGANINAAPAWNLGLSALQMTAFVGDAEVADLLIRRGADVNAPAGKCGGGTALALAARKGHVDVVRLFLEAGAAIPAPGVTVSSFGVTYYDHGRILDLLCISAPGLTAIYGGNGIASRDYHEYEAEWAHDPTYENKG